MMKIICSAGTKKVGEQSLWGAAAAARGRVRSFSRASCGCGPLSQSPPVSVPTTMTTATTRSMAKTTRILAPQQQKRHHQPSSLSSLSMSHRQVSMRFFGSRKKPSPTQRRAQLASERRIERKLLQQEQAKSKELNKNSDNEGEQILSESGMLWGFFLSLGVAPLVAFGVTVSSTPHLRQQWDEAVASIIGGSGGGGDTNYNESQSSTNDSNPEHEDKNRSAQS